MHRMGNCTRDAGIPVTETYIFRDLTETHGRSFTNILEFGCFSNY